MQVVASILNGSHGPNVAQPVASECRVDTETSVRAIERNARMSTRPSNARVPQQNVSNVYTMVKLTLLAMSSPQLTARYVTVTTAEVYPVWLMMLRTLMDHGRTGSHGSAVVPRALVVTGSEAEHVTTLHRSAQECHVPDQMRKQNLATLINHAVSQHHGANGQNVQRHAMVQVNSSGTVTTLTPTIQPSTVTKHW